MARRPTYPRPPHIGRSRALLALLMPFALLVCACDQYRASADPSHDPVTPRLTPAPEGTADALSSVCRIDAVAPTIAVETLRGPEGACVPPAAAVAMRCDPTLDPIAVVEAGSGEGRRYLGGTFAVPTGAVPADAASLGVGPTGRYAETSAFPRALYLEAGSQPARWLSLVQPSQVGATPSALLIGDSIMDGSGTALAEALPGWEISIDAVVGRSSSGGIAVAEGTTLAPDVVVVELGTNDTDADTFRANAAQILSAPAVAEADLVVWLTAHNPQAETAAINHVIVELVGSLPHGTVADWDRFVPPEALNGDGVHLAPGQEPVFATFVVEVLETWRAAVHGRGAGRCMGEVLAAAGID